MQRWLILGILVTLLVGCVEAPTTPAPLAYATVIAYTDPLSGKYDTIIPLYDKPINSQSPKNLIGKVHEGERVGITEQHPDGDVRIRTNTMLEGWTRIEALKDISGKG
jgi:hypothetical protein